MDSPINADDLIIAESGDFVYAYRKDDDDAFILGLTEAGKTRRHIEIPKIIEEKNVYAVGWARGTKETKLYDTTYDFNSSECESIYFPSVRIENPDIFKNMPKLKNVYWNNDYDLGLLTATYTLYELIGENKNITCHITYYRHNLMSCVGIGEFVNMEQREIDFYKSLPIMNVQFLTYKPLTDWEKESFRQEIAKMVEEGELNPDSSEAYEHCIFNMIELQSVYVGQHEAGDVVDVPDLQPDESYKFLGWFYDREGTLPYTEETMTAEEENILLFAVYLSERDEEQA